MKSMTLNDYKALELAIREEKHAFEQSRSARQRLIRAKAIDGLGKVNIALPIDKKTVKTTSQEWNSTASEGSVSIRIGSRVGGTGQENQNTKGQMEELHIQH